MTPPVVSPGRPQLLASIRSEIAARGPLTFARFMELALYHPQWGYYTAPDAQERIGRRGDFYTNVSVGALFGGLLAMQFVEMWEAMDKPAKFTLLELGAHRGQLAADVRAWAARERPDFSAALDLVALDYPGELPKAITGCIFSNELVDALPVHLITRRAGEWLELFVAQQEDRLSFAPGPFSCDTLREEVSRLPLTDSDGFVTEVHLEAGRWMERVARSLQRGFVLTIDYGYSAEDYYAPHRKAGTLLCYHQHRSNNDPLLRAGGQDITAHVNFTTLVERGAAAGLLPLGLCDQSRFVAGLIEKAGADFLAKLPPKAAAQLKTLLHPELMGQTFKVLVQHRSVGEAQLRGLKFAR
ncbi:MAG: SAM-dependent methyltransferase [Verrucomicrobia bacterium]|nr:SAM-dependent methyltransferase [Verrucomicrobiota bacterium]